MGLEHAEHEAVAALAARVTRLERSVRTWRRAASGAIATVALGGLLGVAGPARVPDVLRAQSFQLVDENGDVAGRWIGGGSKPMRLEALSPRGDLISGIELHAAEPFARVISPRGVEPSATAPVRQHTPAAVAPQKKGSNEEEEDDPFDFVD